MKITINIDCTPQEARQFMGLPNVEPLHEAMTEKMTERMEEYFASLDPETFVKTWLPKGIGTWEEMGKAFWAQFGKAAGGKDG